MTQFRILVTIVVLSFTLPAFSATVSGEAQFGKITTKKTVTVSATKKPVQKIIVRNYSRTVSYTSPAGKEFITFALSTKNGIIVSASARPRATNKISKSLQIAFSKNLSKTVVGKNVKNLTIDAVGGASLTTTAFTQFAKNTF